MRTFKLLTWSFFAIAMATSSLAVSDPVILGPEPRNCDGPDDIKVIALQTQLRQAGLVVQFFDFPTVEKNSAAIVLKESGRMAVVYGTENEDVFLSFIGLLFDLEDRERTYSINQFIRRARQSGLHAELTEIPTSLSKCFEGTH